MSRAQRKIVLVALVLLLAALAYGLWLAARPGAVVLQGQMDARQTDIAAKVPGRIERVLVTEGQHIGVGTPLIEMASPEIDAKLAQAKAAQAAAEAVARKADNGARPQEVEMAYQNWRRAQAAADLAAATYRRIQNLANEGLVARQKRDEAYTQYVASRDQAAAARAQYDMARSGARSEDKDAAHAQAQQVAAAVAEAEVAAAEARLSSPIAGEVAEVMVHAGEIVPQGVPLLTLINRQEQWLVLHVREDQLAHFGIGQRFAADIPALGEEGRNIGFSVYASKVLPDFATWRATRNQGSFDMRTFEIKARPEHALAAMRPGMSVLVTLPH